MIRTIMWVAVTAALLAGCAGLVKPADPRFVAMVADLEPAMERVSRFGAHRSPEIPQIMVSDDLKLDVMAAFIPSRNVIVVNRKLLEAHQWFQRVILAHELGHWAKWRGSLCHKDRLACEIGANAASVPILEVGWGISYAEAVEQVYWMVALLSHHLAPAELAAFRKTFGCSDPTGRTCHREIPGLDFR